MALQWGGSYPPPALASSARSLVLTPHRFQSQESLPSLCTATEQALPVPAFHRRWSVGHLGASGSPTGSAAVAPLTLMPRQRKGEVPPSLLAFLAFGDGKESQPPPGSILGARRGHHTVPTLWDFHKIPTRGKQDRPEPVRQWVSGRFSACADCARLQVTRCVCVCTGSAGERATRSTLCQVGPACCGVPSPWWDPTGGSSNHPPPHARRSRWRSRQNGN